MLTVPEEYKRKLLSDLFSYGRDVIQARGFLNLSLAKIKLNGPKAFHLLLSTDQLRSPQPYSGKVFLNVHFFSAKAMCA